MRAIKAIYTHVTLEICIGKTKKKAEKDCKPNPKWHLMVAPLSVLNVRKQRIHYTNNFSLALLRILICVGFLFVCFRFEFSRSMKVFWLCYL